MSGANQALARMSDEFDFRSLNLRGLIEVAEQTDSGGYSDVSRGTLLTNTGKVEIAIKTLRLRRSSTMLSMTPPEEHLQKRFRREVVLWRKLRHPNVVPLLGVAEHPNGFPSLISPWYPYGCLSQYLRSHPQPNRPLLALDITTGLEYLHSIQVVHGDIKPDNVVVDSEGRASLCDFGMSQFLDAARHITGYTTTDMNGGGTHRFLCPELIEDGPKTMASDIWALGCLIVQLFTGRIPYQNIRHMHAISWAIMNNEPPMIFAYGDMSEALWNILSKCWGRYPETRPTAAEIRGYIKPIEQSKSAEMLKRIAPSKLIMYHEATLAVAFSPTGQYLAISPLNGPVDLYDVGSDGLSLDKVMWDEDFFCRRLLWSPTGRYLLAHSLNRIIIWELETGTVVNSIVREDKIQTVAWLPSGNSLAVAEGSRVIIMDMNCQISSTYSFWLMVIVGIAFTPDRARMVLVAKSQLSLSKPVSQRIILYNMNTMTEEHRVATLQDLRAVEIGKDGRHLIVSYFPTGCPQLWRIDETRSASAKLTLLQTYNSTKSGCYINEAHFGGIRDHFVICTAINGDIHILDRETADLLVSIPAEKYYRRLGSDSFSLSWNPASKNDFIFATSDCERGVQVWSSPKIPDVPHDLATGVGMPLPLYPDLGDDWDREAMGSDHDTADNILCAVEAQLVKVCCNTWSHARRLCSATAETQIPEGQGVVANVGQRALHGINALRSHVDLRYRNSHLSTVSAVV